MGALHIKLRRDIIRLWPQALAIAMVMAAGVATLILGAGAHDSLSTTRTRYYEANRFADVFATATRVPESVATEIAAIGGVASVDTRIQKIALADIADMAEPASVVLVSLPGHREPALNRLVSTLHVMDRGRLIASGKPDTVLADPRVRDAYLGGAAA